MEARGDRVKAPASRERPDTLKKQPTKAEYDATVDDAGVHVVHRPTESYYDYYPLG
jgi:hypothetical protein